jgi:hypothetical protein
VFTAFIDCDIILHHRALAKALWLARDKKTSIVFSVANMGEDLTEKDKSRVIADSAYFDQVAREQVYSRWGYGAVMVPTWAMRVIRGYDERYYGPWVDDVDFVDRLERRGVKTIHTASPEGGRFKVIHQKHPVAAGGTPGIDNEFTIRNRKIRKQAEGGSPIRNPNGWGKL